MSQFWSTYLIYKITKFNLMLVLIRVTVSMNATFPPA